MIEVDFWYKGLFGRLKNKLCYFPENWNEADERFLTLYAKWAMSGNAGWIWDFVIEYQKITKRVANCKGGASALIDGLFPKMEVLKSIATERTFIEKFKIGRKKYVGPKEQFFEMSVAQQMYADMYFREWKATKNSKLLDKFVAVLYLPEGENFNKATLDARSALFRKLPIEKKNVVHLNYLAMLAWFEKHERYGHLFAASENDAGGGKDMSDVVYALAGTKLGTVDQVESCSFIYIIHRISELPEDVKEKEVA